MKSNVIIIDLMSISNSKISVKMAVHKHLMPVLADLSHSLNNTQEVKDPSNKTLGKLYRA